MDAFKLHLLLNHYPMIGTIAGLIVLLLGLWRKSIKLKRISLWVFFAAALVSVAVIASGEIAGRGDGILAGSTGELVRQHQESARLTFVLIGSNGIAAVFGLIMLYRGSFLAAWFILAVLILSLTASVLVTRTTLQGRNIKYGAASIADQDFTNSK